MQPLRKHDYIATTLKHGSTECSHFGDVVALLQRYQVYTAALLQH
jgi:hypothetical protein